ncbi:MAG: T9SS type A sorting domain-containing protein, partial [Candidatus Delongbacteria bacterium]|nr:T9SS type A sorting domain-containing protein [Candidatus Delongbacteria bacterium]
SGYIFNAPLPSTSMPENIIAWMAYDLHPGSGSCHYYYDSSNHQFIVQFNNWTDYGSRTGNYTSQIIIKENGKILLQYKTIINAVSGAVGIQNSDRTSGMTISYNNAGFFKDLYAIEIFNNPSYWLSLSDESLFVSAGNSDDITLDVSALDLLAGIYELYVSIIPEDYTAYTESVPVALTVVGAPNISVQDSVDFNTVFTGVTDSLTVIFNNIGTDTLNISAVDFSITEFSIDTTAFSVPPKSSVERTVSFNSAVSGIFNSIMTINSNDPDEPARSVILRAEAVDPPIISVSPEFFDVTVNSGDSTVQTLTISNTGGSDLDWHIDISEADRIIKTTSLYEQYKHLTSYEESSDKHNSGAGKVAPIPMNKIEELKGDIQILAWTTYADMAREYPNTLNAISQYFTDYTVSTSTSTNPAALNAELSGKDIFLIPEQEGGSASIFTSLGSSWATTLTNFVNNGGTVIFCGSNGVYYPAHEILNSSGLMTMSYSDWEQSGTMTVDTTHFITDGLPASIPAQDATSLYTITDSSSDELVTMYGNTAIAAKEMGRGHVVLLGYDYYDYDDNAAKLISNAIQWAGSFSEIDPDITSGTIYAGSSQGVLITVQTIDMNAGEYNYNINITSNDPVNPEIVVQLKVAIITSISDDWPDLLPKQYKLKQNYPNPFNPLTTIVYGLPEQAEVTIEIYNMLGQKVETLINGDLKQAGYHKVEWNTQQLSGGIYFYRINAIGNKKFSSVKKMVLTK